MANFKLFDSIGNQQGNSGKDNGKQGGGSPAPAGGAPPQAAGGTPPAGGVARQPLPVGGGNVQGQNVGTGFVNLQNVLSANKGAASGMVDTLAGKANQLGTDASGAIQAAEGQYNKDVQGGLQPWAWDYSKGGWSQAAPTGPASMAQDKNVDYNALQRQASEAQDYANNLGSFGGLKTLLQGQYGAGQSYTGGQSTLDSVLTKRDADSRGGGKHEVGPFNAAQQQFGGLSDALEGYNHDTAGQKPTGGPPKPTDPPAPANVPTNPVPVPQRKPAPQFPDPYPGPKQHNPYADY